MIGGDSRPGRGGEEGTGPGTATWCSSWFVTGTAGNGKQCLGLGSFVERGAKFNGGGQGNGAVKGHKAPTSREVLVQSVSCHFCLACLPALLKRKNQTIGGGAAGGLATSSAGLPRGSLVPSVKTAARRQGRAGLGAHVARLPSRLRVRAPQDLRWT